MCKLNVTEVYKSMSSSEGDLESRSGSVPPRQSETAERTSRSQAIEQYITLARKKRRTLSTRKSKAARTTTSPREFEDQLMIPIGKMYHCTRRGRGVMVKKFQARKVIFRRESSYKRMLEKCRNEIYPDTPEGAEYYLADSSGVAICSGVTICIDQGDGTEEQIPWTLAAYIRLSNIKFPSKCKFYCVEILPDPDSDSMTAEAENLEENRGSCSRTGENRGEEDNLNPQSLLQPESGSDGQEQNRSSSAEIAEHSPLAEPRFEPIFMLSGKSKYAEKYWFHTGLTQEEALGWNLESDQETMFDVQDAVVKSPHRRVLFPQNPCYLGFHFSGIQKGVDDMVEVIGYTDGETGSIEHRSPEEGAQFEVWADGVASPEDNVALLACVALHGFHSVVSYQWAQDGTMMSSETFPITYVTSAGSYVCKVTAAEMGITEERQFEVKYGGSGMSIHMPTEGGESISTDMHVPTEGGESISTDMHVPTEGGESVSTDMHVPTEGGESISTDMHMPTEGGESISTDVHMPEGDIGLGMHTLAEQRQSIKSDGSICRGVAMEVLYSEFKDITPADCIDCKEVRLLDRIGQGSFGMVHRAIWRGTLVAAKVMHLPGATSQIAQREIHSCRQVQHPNILMMLGSVQQDSTLMIITNLVHGPNLHDLIFESNYSRISESTKMYVALQICQALMFLHTSSPPLAHLDVKPANVLVELKSYHSYLADFGLSKMMTAACTIGTKTMLAGSPGFQSPEQLRGESLGIATDIYAFGGVLTVLFGEKPLWPGLSPYQIMWKVTVTNLHPSVSHLPKALQEITQKCFAALDDRPRIHNILELLIGHLK